MNSCFKPALQEKQPYKGKIIKYEMREGRFLVYVELDEEPRVLYINSQRFAMREQTPFHKFCINMDLINRKGELDYSVLLNLPVVVQFSPGKDETMFISSIKKLRGRKGTDNQKSQCNDLDDEDMDDDDQDDDDLEDDQEEDDSNDKKPSGPKPKPRKPMVRKPEKRDEE